MAKTNDRPSNGNDQLVELAIIAVAAIGALSWGSAKIASLLFDDGQFHADLAQSLTALVQLGRNPTNPAAAWPEPTRSSLPGPLAYWSATLLTLALLIALAAIGWRLVRSNIPTIERRERLGVRAEPRMARRRDLHDLYVRRLPGDRFLLGRHGRRLVAAEATRQGTFRRPARHARGPVALIGPSRSGKSTQAIAGIGGWTGPAIIVSVKADLLHDTHHQRAALGEVKIFDPTGVTHRDSAAWSPLRSAATLHGAMKAAKRLSETAPRSTSGNDARNDFWLTQAETLLAGLLLVAANTDHTITDVVDWVIGADMPTEHDEGAVLPLLRAMQATGDPAKKTAATAAMRLLRGVWKADPRTASSVYASAKNIVWPWNDPIVAAASTTCDIDWDWLTTANNTLYVCAPLTDQQRLAPVLSGVLVDLMDQAFDRHVATNQPFDPAVLFVIDEAANCRLDALPQWAATVSGVGIQLVTAWQSRAQIEAVYGHQADAILTNHLSKLFFPGMSDQSGLTYVSALTGHEHIANTLGRGATTTHRPEPSTAVPVLPAHVLRQMRPGRALLVHGQLPPVEISTAGRSR